MEIEQNTKQHRKAIAWENSSSLLLRLAINRRTNRMPGLRWTIASRVLWLMPTRVQHSTFESFPALPQSMGTNPSRNIPWTWCRIEPSPEVNRCFFEEIVHGIVPTLEYSVASVTRHVKPRSSLRRMVVPSCPYPYNDCIPSLESKTNR